MEPSKIALVGKELHPRNPVPARKSKCFEGPAERWHPIFFSCLVMLGEARRSSQHLFGTGEEAAS
ncbi:MAG: hypothetical protein DMG41_21815 [Acidobacteria bacterium]|nr:MAG: hypothetical protein DMG41_21815 [Acidobacteriota bacterium]